MNKDKILREIEKINLLVVEKMDNLYQPSNINNGYCWVWCIFFLKVFPNSILMASDRHAFVKHGDYFFDSDGAAKSWHRLKFFGGKLNKDNRGEAIIYDDLGDFIHDWDITGKRIPKSDFQKMLKNEPNMAKYVKLNTA